MWDNAASQGKIYGIPNIQQTEDQAKQPIFPNKAMLPAGAK